MTKSMYYGYVVKTGIVLLYFQISAIAKQSNSQLSKYVTKAGDELEYLHEGDKSAQVRNLDMVCEK